MNSPSGLNKDTYQRIHPLVASFSILFTQKRAAMSTNTPTPESRKANLVMRRNRSQSDILCEVAITQGSKYVSSSIIKHYPAQRTLLTVPKPERTEHFVICPDVYLNLATSCLVTAPQTKYMFVAYGPGVVNPKQSKGSKGSQSVHCTRFCA